MINPAMFTPWMWKLGAVALAVAFWSWWMYDAGRDSKQAALDALKQSYELAAAQAAGARKAREQMWQEAITTAGAKYDERAKVADAGFDANLDRLRNAYASGARLRIPASVAGGCPESGGPTAAELLRAGQELAGILRDADRDAAALRACVSAWPR